MRPLKRLLGASPRVRRSPRPSCHPYRLPWRSSCSINHLAVRFIIPRSRSLKRFAKALDHPAPWKDESLLRRPEKEDSPSRRRGHGQKRGGANLGGQPLFDQTLRRYGTPGEVSHSEEASRLAPEDR